MNYYTVHSVTQAMNGPLFIVRLFLAQVNHRMSCNSTPRKPPAQTAACWQRLTSPLLTQSRGSVCETCHCVGAYYWCSGCCAVPGGRTTEPLCSGRTKWAPQEWVHEIVMHVSLRPRDTAGCHFLKPQRIRAHVLNVREAHKGRAAVPCDTKAAFCDIQPTEKRLLRAETSSSHRQMQQ